MHRHMFSFAALALMAKADDAGAAAAPDPAVTDPATQPGDLAGALAAPLPNEPEAAAVHTEDDGSPKLFVALKLPQGLDLSNGVVLNGMNHSSAERAGGYGITVVNADVFNAWAAKHQDMDIFKKSLIFAGTDAAKVVAQAREQENVSSGFEQTDPSKIDARLAEEESAKASREAEKAKAAQ